MTANPYRCATCRQPSYHASHDRDALCELCRREQTTAEHVRQAMDLIAPEGATA